MPTRPHVPRGLGTAHPAAPRGPAAGPARGGRSGGPAGERFTQGGDRLDVSLRLAIGRDGVGVELAHPARLACLKVTELSATLPGARFPIDVSGGVSRFRHRRGHLQALQIEITASALERWCAPRLAGVVATRAPAVWVGVRPAAATVCAWAFDTPDEDRRTLSPIVAFDLEAVADGDGLALIVTRARGTNLPAPPSAVAIACAQAIVGRIAARQGSVFLVSRAASRVARAVLPEAGARVPSAEGVSWTSISGHARLWILHASRDGVAAAPTQDALRAREAASLNRDGDEALLSGDSEGARGLYVEALDRAPRHAETLRRILEIDARAPQRAHAALSTLAESGLSPDVFGTLSGELLAAVGDIPGAMASLERAGETEPAPPLAARAYEMAASLTRDAEQAARWLDRAVLLSSRSASARWSRLARRIELGRIEDALADVEHLEAIARGGPAKHAVWLRAGKAWQAAGLGTRAGQLFERALRFVPDEPVALGGLGAALVGEGREAQGVAILTRAVELAQTRPTVAAMAADDGAAAQATLALARALAERLDDLPAAIARVTAIPAHAPEAPLARGLEGRWRARLGDIAGGALAFARLRELVAATPPEGTSSSQIVALLAEAADHHRTQMGDPLGAQRYLAAALRLRPQDASLRQAYRETGVLIARGEAPHSVDAGSLPPAALDEGQASARVEELTRRLHADPRDDVAADELASLLEQLGRGHELLALLSARLEDATPEGRTRLAPRARAALSRLADEADAGGRPEEAALYRAAIQALPD